MSDAYPERIPLIALPYCREVGYLLQATLLAGLVQTRGRRLVNLVIGRMGCLIHSG